MTRIDPRRDGGATVRFEGVEVEALRDLAQMGDLQGLKALIS